MIGCALWCWSLSPSVMQFVVKSVIVTVCPGFYPIEAWLELTEDLVVVSAGHINSLEVTLLIVSSLLQDDASFRVKIGECVDFYKSVGCNLLMMKGLGGEIY